MNHHALHNSYLYIIVTTPYYITHLVASSAAVGDSGSRSIKISQLVHQSRPAEQVLGQCIGHRADCEDGNETPGIGDHARSKPRAPMARDTPACRQGPQLPAPKRMALTPREARPGWCRICQTSQGSPRGVPNQSALHGGPGGCVNILSGTNP